MPKPHQLACAHATQMARAECRRRKLQWRDVQEAAADLRERAIEAGQLENEIRRLAWCRQTTAGCHAFWRIGWRKRYRRQFDQGDWRGIKGFDVTADGMARDYPHLFADGDCCETLFNLLAKPYWRQQHVYQFYAEAIEFVAAAALVATTEDDF